MGVPDVGRAVEILCVAEGAGVQAAALPHWCGQGRATLRHLHQPKSAPTRGWTPSAAGCTRRVNRCTRRFPRDCDQHVDRRPANHKAPPPTQPRQSVQRATRQLERRSLAAARFHRLQNVEDRPSGTVVAQPSVAHAEASAPGSTGAGVSPVASPVSSSRARRASQRAAHSCGELWPRKQNRDSEMRTAAPRSAASFAIVPARDPFGARGESTGSRPAASPGSACGKSSARAAGVGQALSRELPAGDGCDVEEPTREHGVPPQSARAPGQNKEHRARDLRGLGRIARLPKRRGINEHQIAFDQRLQAIRITMARPGFETFSIQGFWNCAAGGLHRLDSIELLYAYSHQQIVQRRTSFPGIMQLPGFFQ